MTREEILRTAKPILFNTDMVRAILDGRKTVTRRVIKPHYKGNEYRWQIIVNAHTNEFRYAEYLDEWDESTRRMEPPYQLGDILYIRETWTRFCCCSCEGDYSGKCVKSPDQKDGCFMYRANDEIWGDAKWRPSIHMPKEAARIFLRVTDVRVERLKDITPEQIIAEGITEFDSELLELLEEHYDIPFAFLWDKTIPKKDFEKYRWQANPWVWVIEFERVMADENVN